MATKIAINGFGRIGRAAFKQALASKDLEVVAINDLTTIDNIAYLLRYDSAYGPYDKEVKTESKDGNNYLVVDGDRYPYLSEKDPTQLPWKDFGVDVVIESTGVFTTTEKASAHLKGGAKRVVISAPAKDEETPQQLVGTNKDTLSSKNLAKITSNASCTTNAVVPVAAIMLEKLGIQKSMMSTIHGYTASQSLVDAPNPKDPLRGRAAAANIVPSHTGAAKASGKAVPDLAGIFDAVAIRVPVIVGSIVDFTFLAKKKTTAEEVNDLLREAAKEDKWQGVFTITEEPLVSTDIIGKEYASIADLTFTRVVDGDLVKIMAWYDNEWGYTSALIKHVIEVGKLV
ncbi:MAG: type I glyceraldehyde-3-phosphate dehydrogenase [Candidatus Spechtbacterales bacterium]|nr:type I glyceraldehyde-3-phosphate dehydrogenase [Candidatus Spechtbacterales bacterium]